MSHEIEILIVEEICSQAEQLKHILEQCGHQVSVEHNASRALAAMRRHRPQVVISAVLLPGMDGYALCREIKTDEALKDIPVILLTSLSDTKDIIRGLDCGADNFVTKPYDAKLLLSRIEYIVLNRELRVGAGTQTGLEIIFNGEKYSITPERQQMVDLLISTYEAAVQKNLELQRVGSELNALNERLEEKVTERTAELKKEIADRQRVEEALRESEERYHRFFDEDLAGAYISTPDGHLVACNPAFARIFGFASVEEAMAASLDTIYPGFKARGAFLKALGEKRKLECYEIELRRRDGKPVHVIENVVGAFDKQGALVEIKGYILDDTERKLAEKSLLESEQRLQQSQKMEAIGTLAGGVAHDFNNLLTAIIGNTHLALRNMQPDDPAQLRLVEVEKAADRAAALTRQLLAFSRRQHLERRTINLNDTISEIMKLLRRIIGEDVEVRMCATADLSAIFADPAQIEQVIMNLAVNARDAMPEGGRLIIETSNIELDESYRRQYPYVNPGKYVQIIVSDTGTGIEAETQEHIFEPFFTTKEVDKGTGLGLSMVYGIVKQHDGHINVYSEVGQGTTFKIFLPVVESAIEQEELATQLPLLGGTETILVAEDEEALGNLARDVLEGLGYTVLLAKNGEEAVAIYEENRERVALLLLDVVMPRMGGIEAYKEIRELGDDVSLILMTGYSSETVQSRFVKQNKLFEEAGAILLQKPYGVEGLGRKVREVLDKAA
jgi:two-component system cell cycle sensor histidine kinase/response regulator CckA